MNKKQKRLKGFLENAEAVCEIEERLLNDPLGIVREYSDDADREVAALVAAVLAYGQVQLVRRAIRSALEPLGDNPAEFLLKADAEAISGATAGFLYRMTKAEDLADLFNAISTSLKEDGSLDATFARSEALTFTERCSDFVQTLRSWRLRSESERGFRYLLVDPADGSTAKRFCLFLRWVVRAGEPDLGLWKSVSASELGVPIDTHTKRFWRYLGVCTRKTVDWKLVLEITEGLKELDADDPLRYDFSVCHLGISKACIHKRSDEHCPSCPIEPVCQLT